jgi:hypothetical protein
MKLKTEDGLADTNLQRGDTAMWITHHGTVAFLRGGEPLRTEDGDDKFLLKPHNFMQFDECMRMVAGAVGLTAVHEGERDGLVFYRFE